MGGVPGIHSHSNDWTPFTLFPDRHIDLKCPFLPHLWHSSSLAGHCCPPCKGLLPHLVHLAGGFDDGLGVACWAVFLGFRLTPPCLSGGFVPSRYSTACPDLLLSLLLWKSFLRRLCCFMMDSAWCTALVAFSKVSSESICSFSDSVAFHRPTTIWSLIISSQRVPYTQCSDRQYKSSISFWSIVFWKIMEAVCSPLTFSLVSNQGCLPRCALVC